MLVEGTYPFVSGGVSSWVHDIILGHPDLRFAVLNVGSHPEAYGEPRFKLPENVVALHRVFCQEGRAMALDGRARAELPEQIRLTRARVDARTSESQMLAAFRRMHLGQEATVEVLDELASNDLDASPSSCTGARRSRSSPSWPSSWRPTRPSSICSGTCARCTCRCCACWRHRLRAPPATTRSPPVTPACSPRSGAGAPGGR